MSLQSTSAVSVDTASLRRAHALGSPRILLLADDLTGACDSASAFLRSGHTARVWLTEDTDPHAPETVWVRHTASRDLSPQAAVDAVELAVRNLPAGPDTLLFKKVDSAGRGNIAAELLAARNAYAADIILLAPSFPATGRIVRDGILHVTDIAGQHTNVSLAALFAEEEQDLLSIARSADGIVRAFCDQKEIILCDAETDADLHGIAQAASTLPARILWAGSAGLANALAKSYPAEGPVQQEPLPRTDNVLVIVGTSHNVTQLQLAHLLQANTGNVLQITCKDSDAADVLQSWQQSARPVALVLTGGDTATFVLHTLEADAIILKGDIAPGVPWGIVEGGLADQCIVVTKSGGFGDEACLTNIVALLRGQQA
jgi:D-threonate/D-erythronate kinase